MKHWKEKAGLVPPFHISFRPVYEINAIMSMAGIEMYTRKRFPVTVSPPFAIAQELSDRR